MKKLTAIFLSLVMVLSMSLGVAAAEDPQAVYQAAEEKTNALTSMDVGGTGTITVAVEDRSTGGMTQTASMDMGFNLDMQVNAEDPQNPQMKMLMDMSMLGETINMEMYFRDQYLYMNTAGEKMKMPFNIAELSAEIEQASAAQLGDLTGLLGQDFSSFYTDFAMTENADGTKTITFGIDSAKMNDLYSQLVTAMGLALPQDVSVAYRDINCSCVVDTNGYLSRMTMVMGADMSDSVTSIKLDMDISMEYRNPGQPVSVVFPDDLDTYPDVSVGVIGGDDGPTSIYINPDPQSDYVVLGYNQVITPVSTLN